MSSDNEKLTGQALNNYLTSELTTMRKFAYSLTGSMEDANDVVQTAVERSLKSGIPNDGKRPWLFKVCKNIWIDEIRRRRRTAADEFDESAGAETIEFRSLNQTETDVDRRQSLDQLAAAFATLSDEHRMVLSMSTIDGTSYEEISKALEIPIGTVMSRVARARIALRNKMQGYKDDQ